MIQSWDYEQPIDYRFSTDSIILADTVSELVSKHSTLKVLDAGAGCGVVGIEFFLKTSINGELHLVEKNPIFQESLEKNKLLLPNLLVVINIGDVKKIKESYDLILCNPPFYLDGHGVRSSNLNKDQCHFWTSNERLLFWDHLVNCLSPDGRLFFVLPDDQKWFPPGTHIIRHYSNRIIGQLIKS